MLDIKITKTTNPKVGNMVMLGAYVAATKILKPETIEKRIATRLAGPRATFICIYPAGVRSRLTCVH